MQDRLLKAEQCKDSPPHCRDRLNPLLPEARAGTYWPQIFLNELPTEIRAFVATVLEFEGGGRLLELLSGRSRMANTTTDLAHIVGVAEETLVPLLQWLHEHGVMQKISVEGMTFYALTPEPTTRKQLQLFNQRRAEWLEQMGCMADWLEGIPHPRGGGERLRKNRSR